MKNKIVGISWFNSSTTVGIVLVETEYGEKAYIKGILNTKSLEEDAIEIAQYGAKFPLEVAKTLVKGQGGVYNIKY